MVVMMLGHGYGGGWSVWEMALMWIAMITFAGLLVWGIYALAGGSRRRSYELGEGAGDPVRILDERLARGEIDADEYAQLREALASSSPQRRSGARSQA
jgi:putative membrane protein